jgi:hypothetical protein
MEVEAETKGKCKPAAKTLKACRSRDSLVMSYHAETAGLIRGLDMFAESMAKSLAQKK